MQRIKRIRFKIFCIYVLGYVSIATLMNIIMINYDFKYV